ncbi:hypothetical protein RFI_25277 [Reticulomyxa filosa]|uniref:Uncharacterized protein n=1 Tax=Reticulomyxa filosa TaxID=46433 RepID=X6MDY1_RETFI|nr:hypothetical protein RFI_25277 [Reticulomyxa filosa]|eukprot:ETO12099.1 hypothetical protein RFI_25277 [Reticulomyxa filosa]
MKSSLVLVVLHVSSASEINTSNCSWANRQKRFTQHSNISILAISRDMLLNHLWKLETWKCEQYLQFYNNMTSASALQIFNNESMQSTNKIIRIFQSALSANIKHFKKNLESKTSTMNILISISTIQLTTCKLTFTSATFRYITVTQSLNEKKWSLKNKKGEVYVDQEIGSGDDELLRHGRKERTTARSKYRLWTLAVINCFGYNTGTSANPTASIICNSRRFFFSKSRCTIQASIKYKLAQSSTRPKHVTHNFAAILKALFNVAMLNIATAVDKWKMEEQRILGMDVQLAAIAGANCDGKSVVIISWHINAFDVIESLLAQMRKNM